MARCTSHVLESVKRRNFGAHILRLLRDISMCTAPAEFARTHKRPLHIQGFGGAGYILGFTRGDVGRRGLLLEVGLALLVV